MAQYKYKFSVVTAVYKVEEYVAETIESLIAQDIGFENIQLILVDDGTPDKSGEICDRYAEKYPNITVIHKENGGVSSARNVGLEKAEGKYINFIDSDDMFSENTFSTVWKFFEANYDRTDAVAVPLKYFEGKNGNHYLNYKFTKKNHVENLNENWDCPQLHVASVFFKREKAQKIRFDTRLAYAEDGLFVQSVIMEKQTLGLVANCHYHYRIRLAGALSAIQSGSKTPKWYLPPLKYFQKALADMATEKFGFVPKYIQMVLMYDLQWRIKRPTLPYDILSKEETEEYISSIKKIFSYIDDDVIMAQRHIYKEHKFLIFMLKYGCVPEVKPTENDIIYSFSKDAEFRPSEFKSKLSFLEIKNNQLIIEGVVARINIPFDSFEITAYVNGIPQKCEVSELGKPTVALDNEISKNYRYRIQIPLEEGKKYEIKIGAIINGFDVVFTRLESTQYLPVTDAYKASYCKIGNLIIKKKKNLIKIQKSNPIKHFLYEIMFLSEILFKKSRNGKKAAVMRVMMHICKLFVKKPIWLISDRASVAGDNGEAFFRYMVKNHPEIDARFVILPHSKDFARMQKIGPVVKKDSRKHKILSLLCEYVISSQAELETYNPLRRSNHAFRDMWTAVKFVFLQHGIAQSDLSGWLNKNKKRFRGLVCSANPEYKAFFEYDYRYNEKEIWLTGLPRFDRLYDESQRKITIMPTWRKHLAGKWDPDTDVWTLADGFKQSEYFKFYNSLINDERLLTAAEKYGYTLGFFPHPTLQPHLSLFDKAKSVEFMDSATAYRDVYAQSDLLITDYSSAVFDFVYLGKPIIYSQFDFEDFFDGSHIGISGYFSYERDGFGEVCYDLDTTVNTIIEYMENGCKLKDKYRERIDGFFAFRDKNNCERVYKKIIETKD